MSEAILGFYVLTGFALFTVWLIAGSQAGRLAFLFSRKKFRRGVFTTIGVVSMGMILMLAQLYIVSLHWSASWLLAWDKVLVAMPLMLFPIGTVIVLSVPRLWKLARTRQNDTQAKVSGAVSRQAADPWLVVPIQAAAAGAVLNLYLIIFPLTVQYAETVIAVASVFLGSVLCLWMRQRSRILKIKKLEAPLSISWVKRLVRSVTVLVIFSAVIVVWYNNSMRASLLPNQYSMGEHSSIDYGGGPEFGHGESHGSSHSRAGNPSISVADLKGPVTGKPDRRFTLTAGRTEVRLSSGQIIEAWTFNGQAPGPELRVRQGELVEVTLVNELPDANVTIHWHGVDVPNGEDGVAGVTQNAVRPGERYVYRFIAEDAGTYWYHSHQQASIQVEKGLFGALVVEQRDTVEASSKDMTIMSHRWNTGSKIITAMDTTDTEARQKIEPGTPVRLRLVNTSNFPQPFILTGTSFKVIAIDGTNLNEPQDIVGQKLKLAGGGRYDVTFSMPDTAVRLHLGQGEDDPTLIMDRDGTSAFEDELLNEEMVEFNPADYGNASAVPFDLSSAYDRNFVMYFDVSPGFYNGELTGLWTINGEVFPDTPTFMVREGDAVKTTFINRSFMDHPMHLHGHHMLVLSRNGKPVTGSPWWTDTLNVAPGEIYEVAFRADNPGIWMDHCHNQDHASDGMTMHLSYESVFTPYFAGSSTGNMPE